MTLLTVGMIREVVIDTAALPFQGSWVVESQALGHDTV